MPLSEPIEESIKKVREDILKKHYLSQYNRVMLWKKKEGFKLSNLNDLQLSSFKDFFQEEIDPHKRKDIGLQFLFNSVFPFKSTDGKVRLEFSHYTIGEKKYSREECVLKDLSCTVPIKASISLILEETGEIKEQEIYICDVPYMTPDGTFIINGAERVVVSQIHRSPGVIFDYNLRANMFHSRLIPNRGPWLEFEIVKDILYVRIDRKARILVSTFFKILDLNSKEEVIRTFSKTEKISLDGGLEEVKKKLSNRYIVESIKSKEEGLLIESGDSILPEVVNSIMDLGLKEIEVVSLEDADLYEIIFNTLNKDTKELSRKEACSYIYYILRGSEPTFSQLAYNEIICRWKCKECEEIYDVFDRPDFCKKCGADETTFFQCDKSIFFNSNNYSLGEVGRYRINKKFNYEKPVQSTVLTPKDIYSTVKHLIKVHRREVSVDDIDHLGNRRVRRVGEQLVNHLKICFMRMERLAKERITIQDHDTLTPQNLISIKPITAGIKEFFGTAQLSQFMDQTNPLAAITHKRRLNALGPGGLTRERAGFEVRDIHYTHYGRMCPIETPEGPNIGLIVSLASFSRINDYGFIETPYYKVKNGKILNEIEYLSAIEEDRYIITPFSVNLEEGGKIKDELVPTRKRGDYPISYAKDVNYMDVSPKQIVSISSSIIPFLEHDDANRALMGSNMQRQAVPLLFQEEPIVGTGVEEDIAKYSGFCQVAKEDGEVVGVDNAKIEIKENKKGVIKHYKLVKSIRTNQDTYYNQRPSVALGEKVKKGDIISDGPSIKNGELALGKNVLVAFMTWEGYNFEDAILMSRRLIKNDTYTSIHVEEFEIEARETKLGKEQITKDIPNVSEDQLKDLDNDGIIHVGSFVKPGGILVGKITPKGHTEVTPEYKLLHSIFGEKARDVKDTSLRVPHGTEGTVVDIKRYDRETRGDLKPGVIERIKVYVIKKRRLKEGDKFAGRHGNKGVVARVIPEEDMPFLEDGTPIDIVLNPLGVPSRMNIGQVFETVLGWAGKSLGLKFGTPIFNAISYDNICNLLERCDLPANGKAILYDGRNGEAFKKPVTVGYMYYLKLAHLADDKIHARSTGPYSLVTQQPLGGKAQFGGQRVGEMEVWAIEAYGASNILQEFLTVKADAMEGRTRIYEAIVKGEYISTPGIPESFNVLVQELRGLALNIEIYDVNGKEISITPKKKRDKKKFI